MSSYYNTVLLRRSFYCHACLPLSCVAPCIRSCLFFSVLLGNLKNRLEEVNTKPSGVSFSFSSLVFFFFRLVFGRYECWKFRRDRRRTSRGSRQRKITCWAPRSEFSKIRISCSMKSPRTWINLWSFTSTTRRRTRYSTVFLPHVWDTSIVWPRVWVSDGANVLDKKQSRWCSTAYNGDHDPLVSKSIMGRVLFWLLAAHAVPGSKTIPPKCVKIVAVKGFEL